MTSRLTALAATLLVLGIAACGGGDDDADLPAAPHVIPTAVETPAQAVDDVREAVRTRDCARLAARWHSANRQLDERRCHRLLPQLGRMDEAFVKPLGTALTVSFRGDEGGRRSAVFSLDRDRRFRLVTNIAIDQGPVPEVRAVDELARSSIAAVRSVDCNLITSLLHRGFGIAQGSDDEACRRIARTGFARALVLHPDAAPRRFGSGRNFTIYGVDVAEDGYYTVVMARDPLAPAPGERVVHRLAAAVRAR